MVFKTKDTVVKPRILTVVTKKIRIINHLTNPPNTSSILILTSALSKKGLKPDLSTRAESLMLSKTLTVKVFAHFAKTKPIIKTNKAAKKVGIKDKTLAKI